MNGSTLSVGAMIFVFGFLGLLLLTLFNPYIRRQDKKVAIQYRNDCFQGERPRIAVRFHFHEFLLFIVSGIVAISSVVTWFIEEANYLSQLLRSGAFLKVLFIAIIGFFLIGLMFVFLLLVSIFLEVSVIGLIEHRYEKEYRVEFFTLKELESDDSGEEYVMGDYDDD